MEMIGDLSTLEKYLRKHHLWEDSSASASASALTANTQNNQGTDKEKDKDQDVLSYSPQREQGQLDQWLEMTQYGLGRSDHVVSPYAPLLRLTDALMSLNYLIATGMIHTSPLTICLHSVFFLFSSNV